MKSRPTSRFKRFSQAAAIALLSTGLFAADPPVEFNRDVRPILSDKCYTCHGPDAAAKKVPFRLDSEAAAKADLGGRRAIVPGDPAASEPVRRGAHAARPFRSRTHLQGG